MFQRIVVPLDGSERAERAVPVAARIARASRGNILLVRVVNPSASIAVAYAPPVDLLKEEQDAAAVYLRTVAHSADLEGIPVFIEVAQDVTIATAILTAAAADTSDLIVLCSHGRTGLARWALGCVAEKIIHHSTVPVLVLRTGGPAPAHPHVDAERPFCALVPLDGSAHAEAALLPAAQLMAALSAPATGALHLVRVLDPIYLGTEQGARVLVDGNIREAILEDARSYLRTMAERFNEGELAALGLQVTWSVREDWDVAATILQVAESGEDVEGTGVFGRCDIICIATHGRGGWQRWRFGSVTERVLHATRLPLLAVPPQEPDDSAQAQLARQAVTEIAKTDAQESQTDTGAAEECKPTAVSQ